MKTNRIIFFFALTISVTSCVPGKKYEELLNKHNTCQEELANTKNLAESSSARLKDAETELARLKEDNADLIKDTTELGKDYRWTRTKYNDLMRINKEIEDKLKFQKGQAQSESEKLASALQAKELELFKKESELRSLEEELNAKTQQLEQREKRVNELEDLLKAKDETVNALKDKVSKALLGFKDKGLTIEQRNGKVYVKMEAKLLFATGSTEVGSEGKKALVELAKVLQDQKDMEVVVEGHTDTDKLNSSKYPHNNWELSVLRATAVVEIMLANSNMDPKTLAASGRSEFLPVSEDKARNRRIEIILTPNLDELFNIIKNE